MAQATKKPTKPKQQRGGRRPDPLTERQQVRFAPGEWEAIQEHALANGFGGASAWIRRTALEALAAAKATPSS